MKNTWKKFMALLTAVAMMFSLAGCNNKTSQKDETTTSIAQSIDDETNALFNTLSEKEKQEIKTLFEGLHIPDEYLQNDVLIKEVSNFFTKNAKYLDDVQFISSTEKETNEFYYTSDRNILFNKKDKKLYIKYIEPETANSKLNYVMISQKPESTSVYQEICYDEFGNRLNNTVISSDGKITYPDATMVFATEISAPVEEQRRFFSCPKTPSFISFNPGFYGKNWLYTHFDDGTIYTYYTEKEIVQNAFTVSMYITDEEISKLIAYHEKQDHVSLKEYTKELAKKYDNLYESSCHIHIHSENNEEQYHEFILNVTEESNELEAYIDSETDEIYIDFNSEITDDEKWELKLYLDSNDCIGAVNYIKQLYKKYSIENEESKDYAKTYSKN